MADNLIFPIGFDLVKGVEASISDIIHYRYGCKRRIVACVESGMSAKWLAKKKKIITIINFILSLNFAKSLFTSSPSTGNPLTPFRRPAFVFG